MSTATESAGTAQHVLLRQPMLHLLGAAVGGVALQLTPTAAAAQKLKLDLSLGTQLVASSNAARVPNGRSDLFLDLQPMARLRGQGGRLKLDASVGLVTRSYVDQSQANRIEPQVDARATAEVIEGWVTLDANVNVTSASTDPFAGRANSPADIAPDTFRQYKLGIAPRLKRDLTPEWQLQAQSDNGWVRSEDPNAVIGGRETTHTEDTSLRLERKPVPVGVAGEIRRHRQFNDAALRNGTTLALDAARLTASYRFDPSLVAGLTVGRERSAYLARDDEDSIVGLKVDWTPTERTWLHGTTERRFFGQAFDLSFTHRTPFFAVHANLSRQPGIGSTLLGTGAAGASMASLLDGLLTTRIPDPIERTSTVDRLITERGLPEKLTRATEVVDQTPQLIETGHVSLLVLGVRHSVALSLYARSANELRRKGELSLGLSPSDFRQRGASLIASRRLTPTMTLSLTVDRMQTDGLAAQAGDFTRETRAKAELNLALAPRTQAILGLGRDLVRSNRTGNYAETRAHVGLLQNF